MENKGKFVLPDPRCLECAYWRSLSGYSNKEDRACHYCLENGKMRSRESDTKCDSFEPRKDGETRRGFDAVPMSQWGCNGSIINWRTQR